MPKKSLAVSKVVEITSASRPVPFEFPVHIEKLADLFGWSEAWIREKCRKDPKRNPNPMPHHKPGKYLLFYPSKVNEWVKAA